MREDDDIAVFYFSKITGYGRNCSNYEKYYRMKPEEQDKRYGRYMINCQAALWRKSVLIEAAKDSNNPWEFEESAYAKLSVEKQNMKYYCLKDSWYDEIREGDVFSYILVREKGYGIWQSKWLWNNKKLLKKEGIKLKFTELPYMSRGEYVASVYKRKIVQRLKRIVTPKE